MPLYHLWYAVPLVIANQQIQYTGYEPPDLEKPPTRSTAGNVIAEKQVWYSSANGDKDFIFRFEADNDEWARIIGEEFLRLYRIEFYNYYGKELLPFGLCRCHLQAIRMWRDGIDIPLPFVPQYHFERSRWIEIDYSQKLPAEILKKLRKVE